MTRYPLIFKLAVAIFLSGFLCVGQPIAVASPPMPDTTSNHGTVREDDSTDAIAGEVAVQLTQDEIDSIVAALPEGDAKQMFDEKVAKGESTDDAPVDNALRSGEEFSLIFFKGEKAFSHAQKRIFSFFTKPASTFDTREWTAALDNLNLGRGFGHLMLTLFIAALLIFAGLAVEWLVRQSSENLRPLRCAYSPCRIKIPNSFTGGLLQS
jgi:hypothetical protein